MMLFIKFLISFAFTFIRLVCSGQDGMKRMAAENLALRQQLIVLARHKQRSPSMNSSDRFILGTLMGMMNPKRLTKIAIAIKPATFLKFQQALIKKKYHLLFSNQSPKKPGPKGPSQAVIDAVLSMKKLNPSFGCPRIAMQINHSFGVNIDKDVVRRILNTYYTPNDNPDGPSWLTFIGHMKDSLWSVDLFKCESILLKTHWVMVVMDQFTRRIIAFAVHTGKLDGVAICYMFNKITASKSLPKYLSSDNDPLFLFKQSQANLRIMNIEEIKTVHYVPVSHPFIERLIGSIRREYLDRLFFWNSSDLKNKLQDYINYYNRVRCHLSLIGKTPQQTANKHKNNIIHFNAYRWKSHCRGLFNLPIAA